MSWDNFQSQRCLVISVMNCDLCNCIQFCFSYIAQTTEQNTRFYSLQLVTDRSCFVGIVNFYSSNEKLIRLTNVCRGRQQISDYSSCRSCSWRTSVPSKEGGSGWNKQWYVTWRIWVGRSTNLVTIYFLW